LYKVGDKVVYPHHGAGTIVKREQREVQGETREYLTIKILHNDMTVNVPAENAERVGLRKVIDEEAVKKVVKYLTSGGTEMPKNWNRRFKHNRDKMKTGDIFELAEVVRNLSLRDGEKGLSTGEKQMYVKAKKILASELMYAKNFSEEDAIAWLEEVLVGAAQPSLRRRRPVAKKPPKRRQRCQARGEEKDSGSSLSAASSLGCARRRRAGRAARRRPAEGVCAPRRSSPAGGVAAPARRLRGSTPIVLVAPPEWEEPAILLAEEIGASKVAACVPGGETRSASVRPGSPRCRTRRDRARPRRGPAGAARRGRPRACSTRSPRGSRAPCPSLPAADTIKRVDGMVSWSRRCSATSSRRADAAGVRRSRLARCRRR
jgi:CarD family transcriptional regulator